MDQLVKMRDGDAWHMLVRHQAYDQNKSRPEYGRPIIFQEAFQAMVFSS